jgi:hypothetical protein
LARSRGAETRSPGTADPDFDLAWKQGDIVTVVEVKSLTDTNQDGQLRLGLGQVLDYQHRLELNGCSTRAVLAVEKEPNDSRWTEICGNHGVNLVWPEIFGELDFGSEPEDA